uniref:Uncharacterized protein n=1 Tax=Arundo donax TaxID=35708 RepID=A0A0A8Y734_ARUDO
MFSDSLNLSFLSYMVLTWLYLFLFSLFHFEAKRKWSGGLLRGEKKNLTCLKLFIPFHTTVFFNSSTS